MQKPRYGFEEEEAKRKTGERIRELRAEAGLTVKSLSHTLDINRKTLEGYEQGEVLPPVRIALELCNQFDCDLDYLLGFQDHKIKESGDIADYTGLYDETVEALHDRVLKKTEFAKLAILGELTQTGDHIEFDRESNEYKEAYKKQVEQDTAVDGFLQYLLRNHDKVEHISKAIYDEYYVENFVNWLKKEKHLYKVIKPAYETAMQMRGFDTMFSFYLETTEFNQALVNNTKKLFFLLVGKKIEDKPSSRSENDLIESGEAWIEAEINYEYPAEEIFNLLFLETTMKTREHAITEAFLNIVRAYWKRGEV